MDYLLFVEQMVRRTGHLPYSMGRCALAARPIGINTLVIEATDFALYLEAPGHELAVRRIQVSNSADHLMAVHATLQSMFDGASDQIVVSRNNFGGDKIAAPVLNSLIQRS